MPRFTTGSPLDRKFGIRGSSVTHYASPSLWHQRAPAAPQRSLPPSYEDVVEAGAGAGEELPRPPPGFGGSRFDLSTEENGRGDGGAEVAQRPCGGGAWETLRASGVVFPFQALGVASLEVFQLRVPAGSPSEPKWLAS